jgi:hypothetical protein
VSSSLSFISDPRRQTISSTFLPVMRRPWLMHTKTVLASMNSSTAT